MEGTNSGALAESFDDLTTESTSLKPRGAGVLLACALCWGLLCFLKSKTKKKGVVSLCRVSHYSSQFDSKMSLATAKRTTYDAALSCCAHNKAQQFTWEKLMLQNNTQYIVARDPSVTPVLGLAVIPELRTGSCRL